MNYKEPKLAEGKEIRVKAFAHHHGDGESISDFVVSSFPVLIDNLKSNNINIVSETLNAFKSCFNDELVSLDLWRIVAYQLMMLYPNYTDLGSIDILSYWIEIDDEIENVINAEFISALFSDLIKGNEIIFKLMVHSQNIRGMLYNSGILTMILNDYKTEYEEILKLLITSYHEDISCSVIEEILFSKLEETSLASSVLSILTCIHKINPLPQHTIQYIVSLINTNGFLSNSNVIDGVLDFLSCTELESNLYSFLIEIMYRKEEEYAIKVLKVIEKQHKIFLDKSLLEAFIFCMTNKCYECSQIVTRIIERILQEIPYDSEIYSMIAEFIDTNNEGKTIFLSLIMKFLSLSDEKEKIDAFIILYTKLDLIYELAYSEDVHVSFVAVAFLMTLSDF